MVELGKRAVLYGTTILFCLVIAVFGAKAVYNARAELLKNVRELPSNAAEFDLRVETALSEKFPRKRDFAELYGLKDLLLDHDITKDSRGQIVRDQNGNLHTISEPSEGVEQAAGRMRELSCFAELHGIPFLYIQAPFKAGTLEKLLPVGVEDSSGENSDQMLSLLRRSGVETLDLRPALAFDTAFYRTDHHWRIETAFAAVQETLSHLEARGYLGRLRLPENYGDLENYQAISIPNCFQGSLGRRTGVLYGGRDDFAYYLPPGPTSFSYTHKKGNDVQLYKTGPFEEALLSDPQQTDYYTTYLNNGYCEMIIKNHFAPNDKKVLLLSDSFGRPFSAYLSLYFSEVVNMDSQPGRFEKNIYSYILDYQPDIVLTMFNAGMYTTPKVFELGSLSELPVGEQEAFFERYREDMYLDLLRSLVDSTSKETIYASYDRMIQTHQEIAKILEAEVLRYKRTRNAESRLLVRSTVQYLLDHRDDDCDGQPGWGGLESWDAFSDGTINPPNQEYGIQVANISDALCSALETDLFSPAERNEILSVLHTVTVAWCEEYWSETDSGGFFWYSTAETDAIETYNISAKLAGCFSRVLAQYPEFFSADERSLCWQRIHEMVSSLIAAERFYQAAKIPIWGYGPESIWQDGVHRAFTLCGLEEYRAYDNGEGPVLPWSPQEAEQAFAVSIDKDKDLLFDAFNPDVEPSLYDVEGVLACSDRQLQKKLLCWAWKTYDLWPAVKSSMQEREAAGYTDCQLLYFLHALAIYNWP